MSVVKVLNVSAGGLRWILANCRFRIKGVQVYKEIMAEKVLGQ